jgi:hypothetical protein
MYTFAPQNHQRGMSVAAKLRIKPEQPLWVVNGPDIAGPVLADFEYKTTVPKTQTMGQVVLFAGNKAELEHYFSRIADKLLPDALLWIAYPKKSGKIKSDITRDDSWEAVFGAGYEPVTQIAIDGDWSALRFRPAAAIKDKLRDVPMEERRTEGIDYVNRTTTLPKDVKQAMKPYKGLETFFDSLAFTHRKEHLIEVVSAKKPETRQRRIDKMVEMLLQTRAEKEKKKKQ